MSVFDFLFKSRDENINRLNSMIKDRDLALQECNKAHTISNGLYEQKIKVLTDDFNKQLLAKSVEIDRLNQTVVQNPLEYQLNNKRPETLKFTYNARTLPNGVMTAVDPRIFFTPNDDHLPKIPGESYDEIAHNSLQYVINWMVYTPDMTQFKLSEEWLFAYETLALKRGGCEDGAILLANIMINSGVPYYLIRINAGEVQGGGHCWVTYYSPEMKKWFVLDWCYNPEDALKWLPWDTAKNYFKIWFSSNEKFNYANDYLDRISNDGTRTESKRVIQVSKRVDSRALRRKRKVQVQL